MKLELQFNESIYRRQMELLYEMGFGKKKTYLKNSNYIGFVFVIFGAMAVIGKGNIGYVFFALGLFMLISYYRFYFEQKKFKLKYEAEQIEVINLLVKNPKAILEFSDDGLFFSDHTGNVNIAWNEFLKFIEKEENMFLITKNFRPFALGKSEVGSENYNQIIDFVASKLEKTSR